MSSELCKKFARVSSPQGEHLFRNSFVTLFLRNRGGKMREEDAVRTVMFPLLTALKYIHDQVSGESSIMSADEEQLGF